MLGMNVDLGYEITQSFNIFNLHVFLGVVASARGCLPLDTSCRLEYRATSIVRLLALFIQLISSTLVTQHSWFIATPLSSHVCINRVFNRSGNTGSVALMRSSMGTALQA